jgi:5-methylcytosine-specific restriction endonuclease McrA
MPRAWKIAPGSDAYAWPECREWGCIVIGWREIGNHDKFRSFDAVRKAMKRVYRRGEPGTGSRAARSVWRFVKKVEPKDIVVANEGRGRVVGIGVVESEYLRPGDPRNPSEHEWLKSARLVDWRVTDPVRVRDYFFVQDTVWPLDPSQCDEIRHAYLRKHPGLKRKLAELFDGLEPHVNLNDAETPKLFSGESDLEGLRTEYRATRTKRSRRLRNKALHLARGRCAVCQRDFSKLLAGRGQRVLQVHHRHQLSARETPSVTKLADLVVVCANCHLLLHLDSEKTMTIDQLRKLVEKDGYLES